jgi:Cthe_2314-like HEPN
MVIGKGRMTQEKDRDLTNCVGLMEAYTLPQSIRSSSKDEIDYFTRSRFHQYMTYISDERQIENLLNDRAKFKLYAAEQHLNRLKEIEKAFGDIAKGNARIEVEMEVDCLLLQLVGAVDSLLCKINDRLDLGIPIDQVIFANVQSALSAKTKKIDLLSALDKARQQGNWFYMLNELRNQSVHRTIIKKILSLDDFTPKGQQVRFINVGREFEEREPFDRVMDIEVIQYLEKSLQQVRELIFSIIASEPLLQQ